MSKIFKVSILKSMEQTLFLMMGLPGAGKTTVAKILEETTGAIRLTSDEARLMLWEQPQFSEIEHKLLYEYLDDQTERMLKAGKSIIYDANLNRRAHRQEKYKLAENYNVKVRLCFIDTPETTAKNRRIESQLHHLVPEGENSELMFNRISKLIEYPDDTEPYTAIDGTKVTTQYIISALEL